MSIIVPQIHHLAKNLSRKNSCLQNLISYFDPSREGCHRSAVGGHSFVPESSKFYFFGPLWFDCFLTEALSPLYFYKIHWTFSCFFKIMLVIILMSCCFVFLNSSWFSFLVTNPVFSGPPNPLRLWDRKRCGCLVFSMYDCYSFKI